MDYYMFGSVFLPCLCCSQFVTSFIMDMYLNRSIADFITHPTSSYHLAILATFTSHVISEIFGIILNVL